MEQGVDPSLFCWGWFRGWVGWDGMGWDGMGLGFGGG